MNPLGILSGLAASVAWGVGDFTGGVASRRAAPARVVLFAQLAGTAVMVAWLLLTEQPAPTRRTLVLGGLAGLLGGVSLWVLYLSLARGKMCIVAPLTAVASGGIPLLVGLATEGLPGPTKLAGLLLSLAAIWIVSRQDATERLHASDVGLPLLAGVGFGVFLTLLGIAGRDAGPLWPQLAARAVSMSVIAVVIVVQRRMARSASGDAREQAPFPYGWAAVAGLGDMGGNAFFILSANLTRLDVAAVLSSLYPAVTVLLARGVLGERLSSRQNVGVGLALAAVALIAV